MSMFEFMKLKNGIKDIQNDITSIKEAVSNMPNLLGGMDSPLIDFIGKNEICECKQITIPSNDSFDIFNIQGKGYLTSLNVEHLLRCYDDNQNFEYFQVKLWVDEIYFGVFGVMNNQKITQVRANFGFIKQNDFSQTPDSDWARTSDNYGVYVPKRQTLSGVEAPYFAHETSYNGNVFYNRFMYALHKCGKKNVQKRMNSWASSSKDSGIYQADEFLGQDDFHQLDYIIPDNTNNRIYSVDAGVYYNRGMGIRFNQSIRLECVDNLNPSTKTVDKVTCGYKYILM